MRNISHKVETLRTAVAVSTVKMSPSTIQLLRDGQAPKGDPLPLARVSAIIAAKKTSDLIPYCHPLLVDAVHVEFELTVDTVISTVTVTAVAKTGVEMEALTAASLAALTIYDMLKPVDDELEITGCRLLKKSGGKSSFPKGAPAGLRAAVLVASDTAAAGKRDDRSGQIIRQRLEDLGVAEPAVIIVSDDRGAISAKLIELADAGVALIITTGGTGFSPRDVTVDATRDIIEREAEGISEAIRAYGQKRTPYAMMSRGTAGIRGETLIINLAGAPAAVEDGMTAIFPAAFHAFPMMKSSGHSE
jgi:molybdenum cofactor biosynthesis protein MoaC